MTGNLTEYKRGFIEFLLSQGALKVDNDFSLKSGRSSPYFVNIGDFNDGISTAALGKAYAEAIRASGVEFDSLYGIPEKGVSLAIASSIGLAHLGINKPWFFTRKDPKYHGEINGLSRDELRRAMIVGRTPQDGNSLVQLDDVFTAGDAKYQAREDLAKLGDFQLPLLVIAVDRQEVGIDGESAIQKYTADTNTRVESIISAADIYNYLSQSSDPNHKKAVVRISNYLRAYGTKQVRDLLELRSLEQKVVNREKSVVIACDVPTLESFEDLVKQTADIDGIGGYKVGFELGLGFGLPRVVEVARKYTDKSIIYDHQKAGTDIPDTGKNFARVCRDAGVDTVIFFPQAGPETERAWIYQALNHGLKVIVGGRMTHKAYAVSEGGFIQDEKAIEIYRIAARAGVNNFVVPGNKLDVIKTIREIIEGEGITPTLYAPGFVAQGGKISEAAGVAGNYWSAIVGRGIYEAQDRRAATLEHVRML